MPLCACRVWSGDPVPREGQRITWATKRELRNFEMPPADKPLVEALQEYL
jgi:8-oxo-dGTP diphosphatase